MARVEGVARRGCDWDFGWELAVAQRCSMHGKSAAWGRTLTMGATVIGETELTY